MSNKIHISTMRKMWEGDPVNLELWTRSGEIQVWNNCIPLRYNFYKGVR